MKKILAALVISLMSLQSVAWDEPWNIPDLPPHYDTMTHLYYFYDSIHTLYERDFDEMYPDIIPTNQFRDLITQCASMGGYTCNDFWNTVNSCQNNRLVNSNCLDLTNTNLLTKPAKDEIIRACYMAQMCQDG